MMSLRSLLLLAFLIVATFAQDECECDDAIAAATEGATKEKEALTAQLSTVESQSKTAQDDLRGCEAKVSETTTGTASKEAEYAAKVEALTKEKAELATKKADELAALTKELDVAKGEMDVAAKKAAAMNTQLKAEMDKERVLLKEAETALSSSQKELVAATAELTELKEMRNKKYFNLGPMMNDLVAKVTDLIAKITGKDAEKAEL
jgi:chromosome segregation ATPase